jgi:hypothetical protein
MKLIYNREKNLEFISIGEIDAVCVQLSLKIRRHKT